MPREFHYRWEWPLRSSPEILWPFVADTNRFDHDAGLPVVERVARPGAGERAAGHRVRTRIAGVKIEWDERPFEWVRPQRFGVERDYLAGPIRKLRVLVEFIPTAGGGTKLVYQVWSQPRNFLGSLLIPIQAGIIAKKRFGETFLRYDDLAVKMQSAAMPAIPSPVRVEFAPGGEARMEAAREAIVAAGMPRDLTENLTALIRTADDLDLTHLRPYACADRWRTPRPAVLALFLRATRAGLLNLQWDVLCPLCRGAQESSATLGSLHRQVHCETCNIDFSANFDRFVELTFRPNPAVREVVVREYCVGGPMVTPHIVAQQLVAAHSAREFTLPLELGRYSVRTGSLQGNASFVAASNGGERGEFHARPEGWSDGDTLLSTHPTLLLANDTDIEQRFIISRTQWADQAVTAAEVTTLQIFRDLFSSEALRAGEQISVGTLAVLFTDLRDSTRLYRQIGDAPAFGRVMSHFDILRDAIAAEQGALVKTIGDAVMAVFRRPVSALRAALRAQARLAKLGAPPLTLKAGIHCGPCIAVTLNERLDYFGSTVNLAARIQRFSEGGDVVISDEMKRDHEVTAHLTSAEAHLTTESFAAEIKGFDDESFDLLRVTPG